MSKSDVLVKYGCMSDMRYDPEEHAKLVAKVRKLSKFRTICCNTWIKASNLVLTDKGFVCKEDKGCKLKTKTK